MRQFFESSLEKIARIITSRYGITVVFQGNQAYTDGKKIVLPSLPREGLSDEVAADLHGYLDHESAHCLFSDFKCLKEIKHPYHFFLTNHCEDSRIEKLQVKKYPGCARHLTPLNKKWERIAHEKWGQLDRPHRIALNIRSFVDGKDALRLDPDTAGVFTKKVLNICRKLRSAGSTLEVLRLCAKLLREINKNVQEPSKEKEQPKPKEEQGEDSGTEAEKAEEAEGAEEGEDGEAEEVGSGSDEEKEDGEAGSEGGDEGEKEAEGGDGAEEGEAEEAGSAGEVGEGEEAEGDNSPVSQGETSNEFSSFKPDSEVPTDIHSQMDQELKEITEKKQEEFKQNLRTYQFENIPHIPFTTAEDEEIEIKFHPSDKARLLDLKQRTAAAVGKTAAELERLLVAKEHVRVVLEQERGQISRKLLPKVALDKTYRTPFQERTVAETRDVAVTLLCDLSGSMGESGKLKVLKETVWVVASALARLGIKFEILGFDTNNKYRGTLTGGVTRTEGLRHWIIKSFDKTDFSALVNMQARGCNSDGESVRWAARRLSEQRSSRKILMVFSDGYPNLLNDETQNKVLNADLRKAVKEVTKFGIETVGIGICTDAVQHFYPDFMVVNDVTELQPMVRKKLKTILVSKI